MPTSRVALYGEWLVFACGSSVARLSVANGTTAVTEAWTVPRWAQDIAVSQGMVVVDGDSNALFVTPYAPLPLVEVGFLWNGSA